MTTHRYPPGRLASDFGRTAFGLAVSLGPLLAVDLPPIATAIFAALAVLFGAYGFQAWRRLQSRYELSEDAIEAAPSGVKVAWRDLSRVSLAYFSVRRDRRDGWMELRLEAGASKLRVDSRLDGFDEIARRSAVAARGKALALDASTVQNFESLGVAPPPEPADRKEAVGDR